jgi:hypothetical protein
MIRAIDQRDAHRGGAKPARRARPAKPATEDDDVRKVRLHGVLNDG